MQCPLCGDQALEPHFRLGIEIDVCPRCKGVWLDRGELDRLAAEPPVREPEPAKHPPAPAPTAQAQVERRDDRDRDPDWDRDQDRGQGDSKKKKKKRKPKSRRLSDALEDLFDDILDF